MKKFSIVLIVMFLSMSFVNSAFAQKKATRFFGIGVDVIDYSTIYIPVNVTPGFRLEPFIGFDITSYDYDGDDDDSFSNAWLGLGVMPVIRKGNAAIYIGGRFGFGFGSREYKDVNGDVNRKVSEVLLAGGPVLGGEYYFNPHLSLGGEVAIMYESSTEKTDYTDPLFNDPENKVTEIDTESSLFIRFYF